MGFFRRLWLFLNTICYLTPGQIQCRLWRMIRICWRKINKTQAPQPFGCKLRDYQSIYAGLSDIGITGSWKAQTLQSLQEAKEVSIQHFCFLQHSHVFDEEVLWEDPNLSQLWRYHLHYFEYVSDLLVWSALGHVEEAYQAFRKLADSWIQENHRLMGTGWHPYTISLRLVNWINALSSFQSQLARDKQFYDRFVSSIYGQGRVLAHDLEFDVRGNHLLKNLKALIWLGIVFKGPERERWLRTALQLLDLELAEQILPDGGHFERAPGYHAAVLKDFLETGLWLRRNHDQGSPPWLDESLKRMLRYMRDILPPDEKLPLLKDTVWDTKSPPRDLLAAGSLYFENPEFKVSQECGLYSMVLFGRSGWEKFHGWPLNEAPRISKALKDSGYYVMRDDGKGDYLIFDAGKPCPDYLPAHAHADMLSYELIVNGQRLVVDSGVYEYAAGEWRDFFRSTRAHNTVEVSEENQLEVWDSFRVARRARPSHVVWEARENYVLVQGEHDGYCRLPIPVCHRRTIVWQKGRFWLVFDQLSGTGVTRAASRVHLHPQYSLESVDDSTYQIKGGDVSLWLFPFGEKDSSILHGQTEPRYEGWYSERFGALVPDSVLVLKKSGALPFYFGYVISFEEPVRVTIVSTSGECCEVVVKDGLSDFRLHIRSSQATYHEHCGL